MWLSFLPVQLRWLRFAWMPAAARDVAVLGTSAGNQEPCPLRTALLSSSSSGLVVLNLLSGKSFRAATRDYDSIPESYRFLEGGCEEAKVVSMEKSLFRHLGAGALIIRQGETP